MKPFYIKVRLVFLICTCSTWLFMGCKAKNASVSNTKTENQSSDNTIINKYYDNKIAFSTLYIKASVKYATPKQSQNVTAEIKIKKDEQILISIRFLGITMAKASITPTKVSYYEKVNSSYYEGDFSTLSQLLGTDLDFNKVQNMLLGKAIDDLKAGKFIEILVDQTYKLDAIADANTKKSFYIDATSYLLNKQEITQSKEQRMIQIVYSNPKEFKEMTLPLNLDIASYQSTNKAELHLEYNTVSFNEELSFPYSVPDDYKRIIIK